jgi:hypothetical protein
MGLEKGVALDVEVKIAKEAGAAGVCGRAQ